MSPSSEHLRSQIYVLTALLSDVQPRRRSAWDPLLKTSQSTAGRTFQHIATLLTRGTADEKDRTVAVTAGPVGENALRLILSTASFIVVRRGRQRYTRQHQLKVMNTIAKSCSDQVASTADEHPSSVTRNSNHLDDEVPLVREATLPMDVSDEVKNMLQVATCWEPVVDADLHNRVEQEQKPALASVYADFFEYLPIVFEVLKYAAQGTREERHRADLFFVTQCRAKISHCIRALFKGYDFEHLRTWRPMSYEPALQTKHLVIDDVLLTRALERKVPLVAGTTNHFVFDSENAYLWFDTLLNLLDLIRQLVDDPTPSSANHGQLMRHLTRLALLLDKIPKTIWTLDSMFLAVYTSQELASRRPAVSNVDTNDANEDDDDELDGSLPSRVQWSSLPTTTVHFVRALYSTFTSIAACRYISHSAILKSPITISYRTLDLPAQRPLPLLESGLFDEWFKAVTNEKQRRTLIERVHNHNDDLKGPTKGTYHCESSLMSALVARDQSDQTILNFARDVNHLLSAEGLDIGVAKKSCASCWLLAAVIKEEMDIDIRLPGTHCLFYPWLPPPHLPDNILRRLKDKLLERLISMVNGAHTVSESRPASTSSGSWAGFDIEDLEAQGLLERRC